MALTGTIRRTVDLDKGVKCDHFERLFATADDEAHTFEITVTASGKPVDLTGAGVMGYFIRKDKETVVIRGSAASNVATLKLAESCYVEPGYFNLVIKASSGGKPVAVYWADGTVTRSSTDAIIDPGHEIPSLEELLAHIAEMEAATSAATSAAKTANDAAGKANTATSAANTAAGAANTAAQAANTAKTNADAATKAANNAAASATSAASSATTAAGSANTAASSANTAAQAANTAKSNADAATKAANDAASAATTATTNANAATTKANAAAGLIENMTVSASKVAPGGSPTAALTKATNPDRYNLALGLVTGDTGAAAGFGKVTASVDNNVGTPSVEVATSGENTAKNFDFKFHNLKGIPGEGAVSSVWGTQPDDAGDAKPEVGGRNLIRNTSTPIIVSSGSSDNFTFTSRTFTVGELLIGQNYIFSANVTKTKGTATKITVIISDSSYNGKANRLDLDITDSRIYGKFTVNASGAIYILLYAGVAGQTGGNSIQYEHIKLEQGVVPTDWSPAPEDLYSAENQPPYPVTSVNGNTGATIGTATMLPKSMDFDLITDEGVYSVSQQPSTSYIHGPAWFHDNNRFRGILYVGKWAISNNAALMQVLTACIFNTGQIKRAYRIKNVEGWYSWIDGYTSSFQPPYPVTSVNGKTGAVTGLYDASNPPPYPVTSVNGKTGAVTLDAASVKARPDTWMPTASQVGAFSNTSVIPVANGGTGQKTIVDALGTLFQGTENSGITSYPTKPGIFRLTGNKVFSHLIQTSPYGTLVIFGSAYAVHLVHIRDTSQIHIGQSADGVSEPSTWYTLSSEDLFGNWDNIYSQCSFPAETPDSNISWLRYNKRTRQLLGYLWFSGPISKNATICSLPTSLGNLEHPAGICGPRAINAERNVISDPAIYGRNIIATIYPENSVSSIGYQINCIL